MGRKRKHESSDERMRRKIREYEDRLAKKRRHRRNTTSMDSAAHSDKDGDIAETRTKYTASPACYDWEDGDNYEEFQQLPNDLSGQTQAIASTIAAATAAEAVTDVHTSSSATAAQPSASASNTADATVVLTLPAVPDNNTIPSPSTATPDQPLNETILTLLGDAPETDLELGPPVHKDIALRWHEIIKKGLKDKNKITDEYKIPNNLEELVPPILNAEVISALAATPAPVKRDYALQQRQKQIGLTLAVLSRSLDTLLTDKSLMAPELIIKTTSDACRLLCELFHSETRIRRSFIISSINSQMKEQLIETTPGKFLFGENLTDRLRTAQNIHRSANILQPTQHRQNYPRNSNLNSKTPYRRPGAAVVGRPEAGRPQLNARAFPPPPPPPLGGRGYRPPPQGRRSPPPPPPRQHRRPPPPPPRYRRR